MGGSLAARLKRIQESKRPGQGTAIPGEGHGPPQKQETPVWGGAAPEGWRRLGPFILYRETTFALDFPETIDARPFLLRRLDQAFRFRAGPPRESGEGGGECGIPAIDRARLHFFDIETTGLSSGAGTIAFAFGMGSFMQGAFVVRQFFLEDYQGEPEFLAAVLGALPPDAILVSYNGTAFDLAVMRTRCILSGLRFPERVHIDLLRTARRLWARPCGGAALSLLEDKVLGLPRHGDLPGSEAPERFFAFLRSSDYRRIEPVLDHHRSDIASLPALMRKANEIFSSPQDAVGVDEARFGLCLAALGRGEWEGVLKRGFKAGLVQAGIYQAALYKRRGEWEQALALWEVLPPSYKILMEKAIAYEKGLGNLEMARKTCVHALFMELTTEQKRAFEKRLRRLEVALAKNDKKRTISD